MELNDVIIINQMDHTPSNKNSVNVQPDEFDIDQSWFSFSILIVQLW